MREPVQLNELKQIEAIAHEPLVSNADSDAVMTPGEPVQLDAPAVDDTSQTSRQPVDDGYVVPMRVPPRPRLPRKPSWASD
jgi:hypothetical protein